ncbi:hypothetical protein G7046_g5987 [Stylonectria norvegica]|nr:hypothetical protein G7046_g5987 [Stylonectria norvegica]
MAPENPPHPCNDPPGKAVDALDGWSPHCIVWMRCAPNIEAIPLPLRAEAPAAEAMLGTCSAPKVRPYQDPVGRSPSNLVPAPTVPCPRLVRPKDPGGLAEDRPSSSSSALGVAMRQGEDEHATSCSSPLWDVTASKRSGSDNANTHAGGMSGSGQDRRRPMDMDMDVGINKTFLDTETLCSLTSFAHSSAQSFPARDHTSALSDLTDDALSDADDVLSDDVLSDSDVTPYDARDSFSIASGTSTRSRTATGNGIGGPSHDFNDETFLLSRQTSAATLALTMAGNAAIETANSAHPPPMFTQTFRQQRLEPEVELHLPQEPAHDQQDELPRHSHLRIFDELDHDHDHLFPHSDIDASLLLLNRRPSSSRSHLRYWHHSKSPVPNASKYLRVSSDGTSPALNNLPSMTMTREEFEALPPTIQRKYFSTLERLRFAQPPDPAEYQNPGTVSDNQNRSRPSTSAKAPRRRRQHTNRVLSDSHTLSPRRRPRVTSTDQRFYASLPEKIKRRHLTEEEQVVAHYHRQSVILDAADEALIKAGQRPPQTSNFESPLPSPGLSEGYTSASSMHSRRGTQTAHGPESKRVSKRADSFYDSFRWLEEDDELDLRLFLDDYHINLREEVPLPSKSRRPSFRRHISINKLPFGRSSLSYTRPPTSDTVRSPTLSSSSQTPVAGSPGHVRRKSRALSLISPNKQTLPESPSTFDPAAAHYQDPEARMKLRVYLASPQKFDEAIEFGFPSMDGLELHDPKRIKPMEPRPEITNASDKLHTFLSDDRSSTYSDVSMDPDSPKTPEMFEKPAPARPLRLSTEQMATSSREYAQASASSREMTLRMTLTRPDLRAHEDQIYGWPQAGAPRGINSRDETPTGPVIYARTRSSRDGIERQLAALDHWNDNNPADNGVVKRIWNRVRRS